MKNSKRNAVWMVLLLVMVILASCAKEEDESSQEIEIEDEAEQLETDWDEPLTIFYESYGVLLNFSNAYPDIKFNAYHKPNAEADEEEWLRLCIKEYGDPDIILIDSRHPDNTRIEKWYQEGLIADLGVMYAEDLSIKESDYVPGTFDVLDNGEALLGIPLSWSMQGLIVREEKIEESYLGMLKDDYTGEELFHALLNELKSEKYTKELFWADWEQTSNPIELMMEMGAIIEDEHGEHIADEKLFESLDEFYMLMRSAEKEYFNNNHIDLSLYQGDPALDPAMYGSEYFGCSILGAPQASMIYAKSVAEYFGDSIRMYWIPTAEDGTKYVGTVRDIALLGGNSLRKEQAYEAIRMMMDMPIKIVNQPGVYSLILPETYSPVNIREAVNMLEYYDALEVRELTIKDHTGEVHYFVEKQNLSEEEKLQIKQVIEGMVDLKFEFDMSEIWEIYYSYVTNYLNEGIRDYKQCYFEIMRALNPESDKWNMTSEEINEYLDIE